MSHGCLLWAAFKTHTTRLALHPSVSEPVYKIGDFCPINVLECLIFFPSNTPALGDALGDKDKEMQLLSVYFAQAFSQSMHRVNVV